MGEEYMLKKKKGEGGGEENVFFLFSKMSEMDQMQAEACMQPERVIDLSQFSY